MMGLNGIMMGLNDIMMITHALYWRPSAVDASLGLYLGGACWSIEYPSGVLDSRLVIWLGSGWVSVMSRLRMNIFRWNSSSFLNNKSFSWNRSSLVCTMLWSSSARDLFTCSRTCSCCSLVARLSLSLLTSVDSRAFSANSTASDCFSLSHVAVSSLIHRFA